MRNRFVFGFSYVVPFRKQSASKATAIDSRDMSSFLTRVKIRGGVGEWGEIAESLFRATSTVYT